MIRSLPRAAGALLTAAFLTAVAGAQPAAESYVAAGELPRLQVDLSRWIAERASSEEAARAALEDPAFCRAVAQHEVLRVTGAANADRVASSLAGKSFLSRFLSDRDWMELYLGHGASPSDTPEGLDILRFLDEAEGAQLDRRIATAVAVAFAAEPSKGRLRGIRERRDEPLTPYARYRYFAERQRAGTLSPVFAQARPWHMRLMVGAAWDNESLTWLAEHINLPLDDYGSACWAVRYRGANDFGETIQGPMFYSPWSASGITQAENIFLHGGVCGSLSTFGAMSAIAHGIPAYTAGQPGHCAYGFWTGPEKGWQGGFGGPDGYPHDYVWQGAYAYTKLAERLFDDGAKWADSERRVWLSRVLSGSSPALAAWALRAATEVQPLNYDAWSDLVSLAESGALPIGSDEWRWLGEALVGGLAPHSQPAGELLARVEAKALPGELPIPERLAWLEAVDGGLVRGDGSWSWNFAETALSRQTALLDDREAAFGLFERVLVQALGSDHYFGQILDWAVASLPKDDAERLALADVLVRGATADESLGVPEARRKDLARRAVLAAEKTRSPEAFQLAARAAERFGATEGQASWDPPPGTLLSERGVLWASSSAYDDPLNHPGVLTPKGGVFHTQSEKDPWVIVRLPEEHLLTGMVLVNRLGQLGRTKSLAVYASSNGEDWTLLERNDAFGEQWRLDLVGKGVRAGWIKVVGPREQPEYFHLRNVCIYGEE